MKTSSALTTILITTVLLSLVAAVPVGASGVAGAKKPSRPPGQGKKAQATVQLQDIDSGTTSPTGVYRWLDIADQAYGEAYRTSYDYTQATVKVSYGVVDGVLRGKLTGRNLKPNFAYQVKLVGTPEADADANEHIGLVGRWWRAEWNGFEWTDGQNSNDADYIAGHEIADSTSPTNLRYRFTGYMVFDYFITNKAGKASLEFQVDSSYHVLRKTTQRARTGDDGPIKTSTFDP
ncbi:MAG: hypothetical protein V3S51_01770, partial [Dehalococcoidia bacterium]